MQKYSKLKVLLYLPNIVGYIRIVLILLGLSIFHQYPVMGYFILGLSAGLDMLDGFLARIFNQTSKFGAILDYALDRATTACYYFIISIVYPDLWIPSILLLNLDIIGHYFHLQSSHVQNKSSHKNSEDDDPWIIRMYFINRFVLTASCLTSDLFLFFLFLYKFYPNPLVMASMLFCLPGFVFKNCVNIAKIFRSSSILIAEN